MKLFIYLYYFRLFVQHSLFYSVISRHYKFILFTSSRRFYSINFIQLLLSSVSPLFYARFEQENSTISWMKHSFFSVVVGGGGVAFQHKMLTVDWSISNFRIDEILWTKNVCWPEATFWFPSKVEYKSKIPCIQLKRPKILKEKPLRIRMYVWWYLLLLLMCRENTKLDSKMVRVWSLR